MRLVSVWAELAVALWRPGHLEHGLHCRLPGKGIFGLVCVDKDMKIRAPRCLACTGTSVEVLHLF